MLTELVYKGRYDDYNWCEIVYYTDDQANVRINTDNINIKDQIVLRVRLVDWADMEIFLALVSTLRNAGYWIQGVEFVYLFGQRSDRVFAGGGANYFADVIAPLINHLAIPQLRILAPHSFRAFVINNLEQGFPQVLASRFMELCQNATVIGGDKSTPFSIPGKYMCFEKHRRLTDISVSLEDDERAYLKANDHKRILIVDDLCDGGRTFIREATALRSFLPDARLELFVVHGLFSQGFEELFAHYDKIYTTNSYQDKEMLGFETEVIEAMAADKLEVIEVI